MHMPSVFYIWTFDHVIPSFGTRFFSFPMKVLKFHPSLKVVLKILHHLESVFLILTNLRGAFCSCLANGTKHIQGLVCSFSKVKNENVSPSPSLLNLNFWEQRLRLVHLLNWHMPHKQKLNARNTPGGTWLVDENRCINKQFLLSWFDCFLQPIRFLQAKFEERYR